MIKVTVGEVINCVDVLRALSNKPIKIKVAYNIAKIIKAVEKENQLFEETRQKLLDKFCEKENGQLRVNEKGSAIIKSECVVDYNNEIKELLESKVEIAAEPIKIEDIEDLELTAAQVYTISSFIEE